MKARTDSPDSLDSYASLLATKVDPVDAIGASVDISAGQRVAATTMPSGNVTRNASSSPIASAEARRNPAKRSRPGFELSQLDMLPERLAPDQPCTTFGLAALR